MNAGRMRGSWLEGITKGKHVGGRGLADIEDLSGEVYFLIGELDHWAALNIQFCLIGARSLA